jgi:transcriptional regulator GlxA family with amidase domain
LVSRIASASHEHPFLALLIDLDPQVLAEVAAQLRKDLPNEPANLQRAVFVGKASDRMLEAALRLTELFRAPAAKVDVAALAKAANMSRSAFFKHFKEVTAVSPIQYQKRLRLLEARRLMVEQSQTAEGSAFEVGYHSASQFSREYSRMFGKSPRQDVDQFIREERTLVS